MKRTKLNEKALREASINAGKAIDAVKAKEYAAVHPDEKVAWAMAAMIHCDICRLVVAFDECEHEGIAKLLWMADIAAKLYEAKSWYLKRGSLLLIGIAKTKSSNDSGVRRKIKEMKSMYPIQNIDTYEKYRNKISYHYDTHAIEYLEKFSNEDAVSFRELLKTFVEFSGEWARITHSTINPPVAQRSKQA